MHKKTKFALIICALAVPAAMVSAQEADNVVSNQTVRAQRQQLVQERQENRQEVKALREQNRLEFKASKEKMQEARCKNIENKIANRVNRYENNGQMIENVYSNMKTRMDRLIARLKSAGADTTKLETDYATLLSKIDKLKADQASFMTALKDSQSFVCGKSEGEFKGRIEQARKIPLTLKQDRQDIKNFFQTTIKADLAEIRAKLAQQAQTQTQAQTQAQTTTTTQIQTAQ